MQIQALTHAQVNKLTVNLFNCKTVTSKAIAITALVKYYNAAHSNASFTQQLTIAYNLNLLENALVRARNHKYFCVQTYISAIKQLNATNTMLSVAKRAFD